MILISIELSHTRAKAYFKSHQNTYLYTVTLENMYCEKSNKALIWLGYFHPFLALIYKLSLWKQFKYLCKKRSKLLWSKARWVKTALKSVQVHCTRENDNLCWNVSSLKIKHVKRDFQFKSVRRDFQFMFLIASKITY